MLGKNFSKAGGAKREATKSPTKQESNPKLLNSKRESKPFVRPVKVDNGLKRGNTYIDPTPAKVDPNKAVTRNDSKIDP